MRDGLEPVLFDQEAQTVLPEPKPTFGETTIANLGYAYDPLLEKIRNTYRFWNAEADPDFHPQDYISDEMKPFASTLMQAKNQEHFDKMQADLNDNMARRNVMADSSIMANLGGAMLDPINLVALPFGTGATSLFKVAMRVGAGNAAIQLGQEALRAPFDPVAEPKEIAFNVGGAFVGGAVLGGLAGIPMMSRVHAIDNVGRQTNDMMDAIGGYRVEELRSVDRKPFAETTDEALEARRKQILDDEGAADEARAINLEIAMRRMDNFDPNAETDILGMADNLFTDSWLYKAFSTPMKRIMANPNMPSSVKWLAQGIAGDNGILLRAHQLGVKTGDSVFLNSKLLEGEWVGHFDELTDLWGSATGRDATKIMDYNVTNIGERTRTVASKVTRGLVRKGETFEDWLAGIDELYIRGTKELTEVEAQAVASFDRFYSTWETRLRDTGLIGDEGSIRKSVVRYEDQLVETRATIETETNAVTRNRLEGRVKRLEANIAEANATLEELADVNFRPANEEVFRPRYWNYTKIQQNRGEFEDILFRWFKDNPETYAPVRDVETGIVRYEKVKLKTDDASVAGRVKEMVDSMLGETDPASIDNSFFGAGKSKHMKHRKLGIPNEMVLDFMERNPVKVMKAYVSRVGPRYEFAKLFNGKTYDDLVDEIYQEMGAANRPLPEIQKAVRDMTHLYDRVIGTVLQEPDALNQKVARALRDAAQLNLLGASGFTTIPEFGRVMMEHGMGTTFRALDGAMRDSKVRLSTKEGRIAGEILEIVNGSAHLRLVDEVVNNPLQTSVMDTAKDAFYALNLLAPATHILKQLDSISRTHTLIDYSVKWVQGNATKMEREYLVRYGIDLAGAERIANAPWQKSKNGLYLANTEAWEGAIEFPATTATVITGDTGIRRMVDGQERYVPAKFDSDANEILFDEEYIRSMFDQKPWTEPKIEGVTPLAADAFKSEDEWVAFVKMHEVYHTIKRPEDLGLAGNEVDSFTSRVSQLSDDDLDRAFDSYVHESQLNEKVSDPKDWTAAQKRAYESGDYAEFSRLRGYTEEEIAQYNQQIIIINEHVRRVGVDDSHGRMLFNEESSIAPEKFTVPPSSARDITPADRAAYENAINKMALDDIRGQQRVQAETVKDFRVALQSGIMNTILMGTPADKPIITDGIAYIPMGVARGFGMVEDARVKGYARVENGLMGLPFQFYSYAMASVNKTTAAMAHGQVKSRMFGTMMSMGLGYMLLDIKTPDYILEDMPWQDRLARSFDYSGVAALYSDVMYTSMSTTAALGGPNITGGAIDMKYPQEPSLIDAALGLAGAGPSVGANIVQGLYEMTTGEMGEGGKQVIRNLPFARLWFWKDEMNQMTRALAGRF